MELDEAMRTTGTCREFSPEPIPDEVLHRAFEVARFGPQGGNRQPVRWLVVRDPELRRGVRDLYLKQWDPYHAALRAERERSGGDVRMLDRADGFAQTLHEVPLLLVVCARTEDLHPTDLDLGRPSVTGGASIYPLVQNLCLALRADGVASALTTLLSGEEPAVRALLGIPEDHLVAALVAVGRPAKGFPRRLRRAPVDDVVHLDRFGEPMFAGVLEDGPQTRATAADQGMVDRAE